MNLAARSLLQPRQLLFAARAGSVQARLALSHVPQTAVLGRQPAAALMLARSGPLGRRNAATTAEKTDLVPAYAALGVDETASEEEVKRRFVKLAKRYHPDGDGTEADPERFKQLASAVQTILAAKHWSKADADILRSYDPGMVFTFVSNNLDPQLREEMADVNENMSKAGPDANEWDMAAYFKKNNAKKVEQRAAHIDEEKQAKGRPTTVVRERHETKLQRAERFQKDKQREESHH